MCRLVVWPRSTPEDVKCLLEVRMVHIEFVHSGFHARRGVGGATVLAQELFVVIFCRILLCACSGERNIHHQ